MEMPYRYIQQGWQCPVCGKVHAPWAAACDCHQTRATTVTDGTEPNPKTTETPYPTYEPWITVTAKGCEPISDGYTALAMAIDALNQTGGADDDNTN